MGRKGDAGGTKWISPSSPRTPTQRSNLSFARYVPPQSQGLRYKKACFDAYNLWLAEYCDATPDRLVGVGQTAMRSPAEGIEDLRKIKELGFKV